MNRNNKKSHLPWWDKVKAAPSGVEGMRGSHAWPLVSLLIMGAVIGLLIGCNAEAKLGNPALPTGFEDNGVPSNSLRAFVYVNTGSPVLIPADVFGEEAAALGELNVNAVEGVLNGPSSEYAARLQLTDPTIAARVAAAASSSADANQWARASGHHVMVGQPRTGEWTEGLRASWTGGQRTSIADAHPAAWDVIRLLPEEPPATPVAAGFVLGVADVVEELLSNANVDVPGLNSAFSLMRVESLAVALYADDLEHLPKSFTGEAIRESGMGALAVAQAGYPGSVVSFLFPRFSEHAGLVEAEVDGSPVFYREVDDNMHLILKNYGSSFFFALSSTKEGAEDIIRSVMSSQGSR